MFNTIYGMLRQPSCNSTKAALACAIAGNRVLHVLRRAGECLAFSLPIILASCSSDSPSDTSERMVSMPIVLAIPASDAGLTAGVTDAKATRAEGDPGTYEAFQLPTRLYIYLLNNPINGTATTVLTPEGMDKAKGYPLVADKWVKTTTQDNNKDSIYTYTDQIRIIIPENRSAGSVYAAMSTVPITVAYTGTDVANATFTLGDDAKGKESDALKNLYSSPYNLMKDNQYYGTVGDYRSNSPHINMVLYHVASKLDLQWNVAQTVQSSVQLDTVAITGLSRGGKLFMPLTNTAASARYTYDERFALDAGSQWYGRKAAYVIPVNTNGSYSFALRLTNKVSGKSTTAVANATPLSTDNVYMPWMVGTIRVSKTW